MSYFDIFLAENRQLVRKPFKLVALLLFIAAGFYGLWKGYTFYQERASTISVLEERKQELIERGSYWLENDVLGPEDRPWVNIQEPFWAMWYANHHVYDTPSPLMIYSIGQADQFAFYKRVSMWTTGYDPDLVADLQNPEFVGIGSLDFTFVWIFLMPVLLLIFLYDIKGLEYDLDFLKSVALQVTNQNGWVLSRMSYYLFLVFSLFCVLMGAPLLFFEMDIMIVGTYFVYGVLYVFIWFFIYYLIIWKGKGQTDQALKMLVIWLLLSVVIPGGLHQYLNVKYPPNYMMDWLNTKRVEQDEIFALSFEETLERAQQNENWFPSVVHLIEDSVSQSVKNSLSRMVLAIEFEMTVNKILKRLDQKNQAIHRAQWGSPVTFFQNYLNGLCSTDYYANRNFRKTVQEMGLEINRRILQDEMNEEVVDLVKYVEYQSID